MTAPAPPRAAIRALPRAVAEAIAAGEVIERPASVVKELLENACDAGASRIEVAVQGAGLELLLVRDDGSGMTAAELPLAFQRHATSKLRTLDDLARLRSFGFRGEALPSVAAAADIDCTSRPPGAALGARLRLRGGRAPAAQAVEAVGAPRGTTIEVRDLFARQPARRKFLAGPRAERAAIARVCGEAALACPHVAFSLRAEGRRLLATPGGDAASAAGRAQARRDAFAAVWGAEAGAAAVAFRGERALDDKGKAPAAGGPRLRLEGLAAPPPQSRGRRDGVQIFVNGRPVTAPRLQHAVSEGYAELLPRGRHPLAAVFLETPGDRVDANVHPAKASVKLADERAAFALIQRTLREALLSTLPPRAGSFAPGGGVAAAPLPPPPDFLRAQPQASPGAAPPLLTGLRARRPAGAPPRPLTAPLPRLPLLRLVGQLRQTFLVAEGPEGMVLVDQHAAHERVLYERLLAAGAGAPSPRQILLQPPLLELTAPQAAALDERAADLRALGFETEPFGERTLRLRALPACLSRPGAERDARALLAALLDDLAGAPPEPERGAATQPQRAAASAACHGALRAGRTLATAEMRALLHDLEACDNPHTCPHGRPTLLAFPAADLERQFGRR